MKAYEGLGLFAVALSLRLNQFRTNLPDGSFIVLYDVGLLSLAESCPDPRGEDPSMLWPFDQRPGNRNRALRFSLASIVRLLEPPFIPCPYIHPSFHPRPTPTLACAFRALFAKISRCSN
jgi:hypothetical protein